MHQVFACETTRIRESCSKYPWLSIMLFRASILCTTFEIYRQAGQYVRENNTWLSRTRVLPA